VRHAGRQQRHKHPKAAASGQPQAQRASHEVLHRGEVVHGGEG
jgi:hypothetical protein